MFEGRDEDTNTVETDVPAALYDRFAAAAEARGLSITDAAREALAMFTDRPAPVDPEDPLFTPLDRGVTGIPTTDDPSDRVDDLAYPDRDAGSAGARPR